MANDATSAEQSEPPAASWREQAVARSLTSARSRAENRVQRFLDAALELMREDATGGDFTVQEVVERSGQSLRSFYQYFAGKHALLLALFEESVRTSAAETGRAMESITDPVERLRCFVVEYYLRCRPEAEGRSSKAGPDPVMVDLAQHLFITHPVEVFRAFTPLTALVVETMDELSLADHLRPGVDHRSMAATILEVVMFNAYSSTVGGPRARKSPSEAAEELWGLLSSGLLR